MISLSDTLKGLETEKLPATILAKPVVLVTADSREVKSGAVFVAISGTAADGHAFIDQAFTLGAFAVIGEKPHSHPNYIQVQDSRDALARVAANFYSHPSHAMTMIAVTGTSGKTTTTYLIESIFKALGDDVGVIGTINIRANGKVLPSNLTTPGPVELQKTLAEMHAQGVHAVVMEVSSHALKQKRAAYIAFDAMVFTNLSQEHLDFHTDMDDYFAAKALLFTDLAHYSIHAGKRPFAAINADDEYGKRLIEVIEKQNFPELWFARFGMDPSNDLSGKNLKVKFEGISGESGGLRVQSPLTGRFNAYNILGALAVAQGLHLDPQATEEGLRVLEVVPGRLERVMDPKRGIHVLVDYAHKPDALEKVLRTLHDVKGTGRLITVFGCGGDRDRTKRPVMGRHAVTISDHVFITSDNPRTEKPDAIIGEILEGTKGFSNFTVEPDRAKAIHAAVKFARPGDMILIAGKGHEDYQIIADTSVPSGTRKIHFDDREVALDALRAPLGAT